MFEAFAFVIVGLVGGVASLMGTLPSFLVAMFGDTSRLTVAGNKASAPQPTIPGTLIGLPAPANPDGHETIDDIVYKIVKDSGSSTGYVYAFDHIITQQPESVSAAEHYTTQEQQQATKAYAGSPGTVGGVTGGPPAPSAPNVGTRVFGAGINPSIAGPATIQSTPTGTTTPQSHRNEVQPSQPSSKQPPSTPTETTVPQ